MTYNTDGQAEPPGLLVTKDPYTICEKELNGQRNHGLNDRHIESGHVWAGKVVNLTKARGKREVQVHACEYCLHSF